MDAETRKRKNAEADAMMSDLDLEIERHNPIGKRFKTEAQRWGTGPANPAPASAPAAELAGAIGRGKSAARNIKGRA